MTPASVVSDPAWEVVIGIETHAQLSTVSKIFSGASTAFGAPPNTQASAVDIALPGVLPVLNKGAVERAIRFGLDVGGTINARSVFARKNYFYPDLPKGYQISQYEIPVVAGGGVDIVSPTRGPLRVRLTRAHLEEDAGKSLHEDYRGMSGIDLNRAGMPLLEIVSEPELRSADEAVVYAKALHEKVRWIDICDGNMQEGSFRCDANVSVRRVGDSKLGTRCEIKNLNSFRFMQQAIAFEVRRQVALIEDGGSVVQETRLYDSDRDETRPMRSKEDAQDYRYFPDPDLPPLAIDAAWIERVRASMPERQELRKLRFSATSPEHLIELVKGGTGVDLSDVSHQLFEESNPALQASLRKPVYALPIGEATALTQSRELADYFEATVEHGAEPKAAARWLLGEVAAALNRSNAEIEDAPVTFVALAKLLVRVAEGAISGKIAKDVFDAMWSGEATGDDAADRIIAARGLKQISDEGAIALLVDDVIAANPSIVAEFRAGKEKAFNALVGKAMAASKGQANPAQLNALLRRRLGG
ncbi:MAG: Asp-tRNA(Asn)/Glu-tRNA(Gln) amidotransferase subunit GatB [Betaproteobacteria bacterium]